MHRRCRSRWGACFPLEALSPGIRMGEVLQLKPERGTGLPQTEMICQGTYVVEVSASLVSRTQAVEQALPGMGSV